MCPRPDMSMGRYTKNKQNKKNKQISKTRRNKNKTKQNKTSPKQTNKRMDKYRSVFT